MIRELKAKGVKFGEIKACPNGNFDTAGVVGVNGDLRIRPFFHQGGTITMREFIIGAFKDEMGLQAWDPILCAVTEPGALEKLTSAAGFVFDPAIDAFDRPAVCDAVTDGEGIV